MSTIKHDYVLRSEHDELVALLQDTHQTVIDIWIAKDKKEIKKWKTGFYVSFVAFWLLAIMFFTIVIMC
jgi:hypothetical protein